MIKYLQVLFFVMPFSFLLQSASAQSLRYSISMPYIGLGAYSTRQPDPFSFTNNQAALAQIKDPGIGVYGERRFLLAENSVYGLALALPTKKMGNFGVQVNYAGFSNFNENKLGLAYARSLGSKLDLGIQFNYYGYRIPAYGNASSINFEAGVVAHLSEKLNAGVHLYNPVGGKLGKSGDEKLASAYKLGFGYDASDHFYFSTEVVKEEDKNVNVVAGVQYHFKKQFFARAGFMSETGSGFAGFGLAWKTIRLDIAASYHPQLGFSPGLMLIYNFRKPAEETK
ncbi:MAG: hypothetical protein WAT19_16000 [Ferruginibacter sp.]